MSRFLKILEEFILAGWLIWCAVHLVLSCSSCVFRVFFLNFLIDHLVGEKQIVNIFLIFCYKNGESIGRLKCEKTN